ADEVVALARAALERLDLTQEPVEVLLGGGLLQRGDGLVLDAIEQGLREVGPNLVVRPTGSSPIVGAAILGLDELCAGGDAHARYPDLTGAANSGFTLKIANVKKSVREARVREVARLVGLEEYVERKPGQLSGGQPQRVAMGRAIIRSPSAFLMDEPLSNLDA